VTEVASRELRNDTAGVLRRVEAGEDVTITVKGKPVARLIAATPSRRRWLSRAELAQRLQRLPGVGVLGASALVAEVDRAQQFEHCRQLPAAVGIVPRQHSSGGKSVLLGITKRGDAYLRWLFIHGARSVIKAQLLKPVEQRDAWIHKMLQTKHANVVAVALAARTLRRAWAILRYGSDYQPSYRGAGRDLAAAA